MQDSDSGSDSIQNDDGRTTSASAHLLTVPEIVD
jgi:hypothetical protein